jgi:hypothetical protein
VANKHLVHKVTESPQIRVKALRLVLEDLWSPDMRRAACGHQGALDLDFGTPAKVADADLTSVCQQNVVVLQISVYNCTLVHEVYAAEDLCEDVGSIDLWQATHR